ncbi:carbohydrate binding domain-containing protein [Pseudomonas sp. PGPR40]|uniref:carbohydrate binding domain-containing protein n=1 Tax=Pseudomonas sp. PGPR40 TaxID=2913476 RepID=UPI001EDB1EED|nr:carbohydrate binding domain-containing protein [Pseudomonas sp. PGPR40]
MTNFSMNMAPCLNNLVKDGDFADEESSEWTFEKTVPESLATREIEAGNPYFASSISGSAMQVVRGITPSTLYSLSVNTRGSERQSDGQDRNPTGYIGVIGGGVDFRVYLSDVHDWKEQKVRFRSLSATDSLLITLFGVTGKLDFDDVLLRREEEVIDPDELIKNGSFNQGEEYWQLLRPNIDAKAQIFLDDGNPCILVSHLGSARQSVSVTFNKTYIFKFRAKAVGPTVGATGGRVFIRSNGQGSIDQSLTVTNDWVNYQMEYKVPNVGGSDFLIVGLSGGALASGTTTYVDEVSLKLKV